jgi:GWxTD domain-containing protein
MLRALRSRFSQLRQRKIEGCLERRKALGLICLVLTTAGDAAVLTNSANSTADWAASPEAYFLTREERVEWKALSSADLHEHFKIAYWRRRDPSPETEENEFRQLVEQRIRVADERYKLGKRPGSRTARGLVFIVLGPPSVEQQTIGPLNSAPESVFPGQLTLPRGALQTTEWHVWRYEAVRLPPYLRTQPSREIAFLIEPGVRDEMQRPDGFEAMHELVARHSIVNPAPGPDQFDRVVQ